MKNIITVFTPTYNRAYKLGDLYKSLCNQSLHSFSWMIVDDGSTDDTRQLVEQWVREDIVDIEYYYQENSGKHVAINKGVEMCTTELFFCVDSDDSLTEDAIEKIIGAWDAVDDYSFLAGIVANRGYDESRIIGTDFPKGVEYSTLANLYKNGKEGDTALVFRTDILRMYPFPVFEGERFLRESIVYNKIDKHYFMCVLRQIIYLGDYFEDGLTRNAYKYDEESPNGAALYRIDMFNHSTSFREKFCYGTAYIYYMKKARRENEISKEIGVPWSAVCSVAQIIYRIRKALRGGK